MTLELAVLVVELVDRGIAANNGVQVGDRITEVQHRYKTRVSILILVTCDSHRQKQFRFRNSLLTISPASL